MKHSTLVNAVGGGDTEIDFRLSQLSKLVSGYEVRYDPEHWPGLYIKFESISPPIFVFNTGKYNIAGAETVDELIGTKDKFLIELDDLGYDANNDFQIRNLVHTGTYPKELELGALSTGLGLETTEYKPENSPGLIYKPENSKGTFVIFRTGKMIYTGSNDEQDICEAFDHLFKRLDDMFS